MKDLDASSPAADGPAKPSAAFLCPRLRVTLRAVVCCAVLLAAAAGQPAWAATSAGTPDAGYRLAGIIDSGAGKRVGFLQLPQGAQVLIRQGSVIAGGGRIVEFSQRAVRIAFPDGRMVQINLEGVAGGGAAGGGAAAGAADSAAAQQSARAAPAYAIVTATDDHGNTLVRHIEVQRFSNALAQQASGAADVTQRLQGLLQLPDNARIVAINDAPVGAAPMAIKTIQTLLARNVMATLNLEGPAGSQRVYLMAAGH